MDGALLGTRRSSEGERAAGGCWLSAARRAAREGSAQKQLIHNPNDCGGLQQATTTIKQHETLSHVPDPDGAQIARFLRADFPEALCRSTPPRFWKHSPPSSH